MRRSLQLSLFAVVLLGLIGGSLAFFAAQKSVQLTVDGRQLTAREGELEAVRGCVGEARDSEEPANSDLSDEEAA